MPLNTPSPSPSPAPAPSPSLELELEARHRRLVSVGTALTHGSVCRGTAALSSTASPASDDRARGGQTNFMTRADILAHMRTGAPTSGARSVVRSALKATGNLTHAHATQAAHKAAAEQDAAADTNGVTFADVAEMALERARGGSLDLPATTTGRQRSRSRAAYDDDDDDGDDDELSFYDVVMLAMERAGMKRRRGNADTHIPNQAEALEALYAFENNLANAWEDAATQRLMLLEAKLQHERQLVRLAEAERHWALTRLRRCTHVWRDHIVNHNAWREQRVGAARTARRKRAWMRLKCACAASKRACSLAPLVVAWRRVRAAIHNAKNLRIVYDHANAMARYHRASRSLVAWFLAAAHERSEKPRRRACAELASRCVLTRLRIRLHVWCRKAQRNAAARFARERATMHYCRRASRVAMFAWQQQASYAQRRRLLNITARAHFFTVACAQVLTTWPHAVTSRLKCRANRGKAQRHFRTKFLRAVLAEWLVHVCLAYDRKREEMRANAHRRHVLRKYALQAWSLSAAASASIASLQIDAQRTFRVNRLRVTARAWKTATSIKARANVAMTKATRLFVAKRRWAAILEWSDQASQMRGRRELHGIAVTHARRVRIHSVFLHWQARTILLSLQARRYESAVAHSRARTIFRIVQAWLNAASYSVHARRNMQQARMHRENVVLRLVVVHWTSTASLRARRTAAQNALMRADYRGCARKMLTAWCGDAAVRGRAQAAAALGDVCRQRRSVFRWRKCCILSRRRRIAREHFVITLTRRVLAGWDERCNWAARRREALRGGRLMHKARSLRAWIEALLNRQALAQRRDVATRYYRNRLCSDALDTWNAARQHAARLKRLMRRFRRHILRRSLHAWHGAVLLQAARQHFVVEQSERIRVYAKRRMLRLWRRISRLRTLTSISGAIYRQSLLSRTIDALFLCISRKRRMRKCERIVLRAVRRVHGRLCRRAIAAWHSYMRQRNSLRNRLRGWYLINAAWETWIKMWSESTIAACVHDRLLRLRAQQTCVAWRVITDRRMRFAVVRWKHLYRHMHLALLRWYRACLRHSMLPSARHRLLRESFDLWIVAVACSKESLLIM